MLQSTSFQFNADKIRYVDTVSDMAAIPGLKNGDIIKTKGYSSIGDSGQNEYYYSSGSSATVDNVFVIDGPSSSGRFLAINQSSVNTLQAGATGDGTTDDRAAILAASNTGKEIIFAPGTYAIASNLTIATPVKFLEGAKLKPANGVRVTMSKGYKAHKKQHVFDISAGGQCFSSIPSNSTQYHWGAVNDGSTDSTAALQACIDQGFYFDQSRRVEFADGYHKFTNIVIGWGAASGYRGGFVTGPNMPYTTDGNQFGGLRLITDTWENGIEVRSARTIKISNLYLKGPWWNSVASSNLGNGENTSVDPGTASNWIASSAPAEATTQYAYSTGIHVDPRCGTKPATSYSDITIPNYADTGQGQYGHAPGSNVEIENCRISGFGVGFAVKGCNEANNADFMRIYRSAISQCYHAISVGNHQARQMIAKDCIITQCHTGFSTGLIGIKTGKPQIIFDSCCLERSYQWVNITNGNWIGFVEMRGCYSELLGRMGRVSSSSSSGSLSWIIVGGEFGIEADNGYTNIPREHFELYNASLTVTAVNFKLADSEAPLLVNAVPSRCIFDSVMVGGDSWDVGDDIAKAIIMGHTCNIIFLSDKQSGWRGSGNYVNCYDPTTGNTANNSDGSSRNVFGDIAKTGLNRLIPFCSSRLSYGSGGRFSSINIGNSGQWLSRTGITVSYTNNTATFTLGSLNSSVGYRLNHGFAKGCILYDKSLQNIFAITDVTGNVITAVQLNNYNRSTGEPVIASSSSNSLNGYFFIPTGHYVPSKSAKINWTSGSAEVTASYALGSIEDSIAPSGTVLMCHDNGDADIPLDEDNSEIIGISSGTITFSGNATETKTTYNPVFILGR